MILWVIWFFSRICKCLILVYSYILSIITFINGLNFPLYPGLCCFKIDFHLVNSGSRDNSVLLSLLLLFFSGLFRWAIFLTWPHFTLFLRHFFFSATPATVRSPSVHVAPYEANRSICEVCVIKISDLLRFTRQLNITETKQKQNSIF